MITLQGDVARKLPVAIGLRLFDVQGPPGPHPDLADALGPIAVPRRVRGSPLVRPGALAAKRRTPPPTHNAP